MTASEVLIWFLAFDAALSFAAWWVWPWFRERVEELAELLRNLMK